MWKKGIVLVIGFILIYFLNVVRITSIVLIGYYSGVDLALTLFHMFGGWVLIFLGTLLLLLISEKILKLNIIGNTSIKPPNTISCIEKKSNYCISCWESIKKSKNFKIDALKVFGLILCVFLILNIQAPVFALTEGPVGIELNTNQGSQMTTKILPSIKDYSLVFERRDDDFAEIAEEEVALWYAYYPNNNSKPIWVAVEIASATTSLHGWEYCLLTMPNIQGNKPQVTPIEQKDIEILDNPPILGRYFVFQWNKDNQTDAVLYWYETSTINIDSVTQQRRIKISVYMQDLENHTKELITQTENQLLIFAKNIASYWEPIREWSNITLLTSKTGINLIWIPILIIILTTSYQQINNRKKKKNNFKAFQKLSSEDRLILESLSKTKHTSTLCNIQTAYHKDTQNPIKKEQLLNKLRKMSDIGFVEEKVINIQDEPYYVWKALL